MRYGMTAYAKVENLVKVAATKDEEGRVYCAPRMQGASFDAMVRAGWIRRENLPAGGRAYYLTAEGEAKLAAFNPEDVFATKHGQKALATMAEVGTSHEDWFHPAVKWVRETRKVREEVYCPDCQGQHEYREAWYTAEDATKPADDRSVRSFRFPHGVKAERKYEATTYTIEDSLWDSYHKKEARKAYAAEHGLVKQPCRRCNATGKSVEVVERSVMVGYILWPKGVRFHHRFEERGRSLCQCQLCGKGISKSLRVPLVTKPLKDGTPRAMWVGSDCARKFTKVARIAKPSKEENKGGLPSILDENYEVPEE